VKYIMHRYDYDFARTALIYHDVMHTANPMRHIRNTRIVEINVIKEHAARFTSILNRLRVHCTPC